MSSPPVHDPYCITLLQAPPRRPQRKRITVQGSKHAIPPLVWGVHYIRCTTPGELGIWLTRLEREPALIMIRGCPPSGIARYVASVDELTASMTRVKSSWVHAAPIYKDLSKARSKIKRLEQRDQANLEEKGRLEAEVHTYTEALAALGWVTRRKSVFSEVPRCWVWLDLDSGLELPEAFELRDDTDHYAALRWIIERGLPPEFHEVSFVGQWSSNAFIKKRMVKAHFTFLFNHALGEGALKAWHGMRGATHWPLKWDVATFRTVQPHYTAAPQFVGLSSPLKQRTFLVMSPHPHVHLHPMSAMKLNVQGRTFEPQSSVGLSSPYLSPDHLVDEEERDKKEGDEVEGDEALSSDRISTDSLSISPPHVMCQPRSRHNTSDQPKSAKKSAKKSATTTSHPNGHADIEVSPHFKGQHIGNESSPRDLQEDAHVTPEVERAIFAQVERLSEAPEGQRNHVLYRCACHLGRYVGGGQLTPQLLIKHLLVGAQRCGLLDEAGESECIRQIFNGIRWGTTQPIHVTSAPTTLSLRDQTYTQRLLKELRRAIEVASSSEERVPILALTCGGGKTTALCSLMAQDAADGLTRVVLCRNHEMAQEFIRGVHAYADQHGLRIHRRIRLLEGIQRHCEVLRDARASHLPALSAALAYGRRALCGQGESRCEHAPRCHGAKKPKVLKRGLTIATHAMGPLLEIPPEAVTLVDELPTPVKTDVLTSESFEPLIGDDQQLELPIFGSFEAWRAAHPQVSAAARSVQAVLTLIAQAPNLSDQDYGQSLDDIESLSLFADFEDVLLTLNNHPPAAIPLPSPRGARRGVWPNFPQRGALETLHDLAQGISEGTWPSSLTIHWKRSVAWIERRERYVLPSGALVCLDGTAHRTEYLWSSLAHLEPQSDDNETVKPSQRAAEIWPIAAVGEPPLFARWVKTKQLRTSQLIRRGDDGAVYWRARAVGSLKRIAFTIEQAAREAQLGSGQRIGILAAKHVADVFRVAFAQDHSSHFDPALPLTQDVIKSLRDALNHRELVIGHVGAHDVGSNLFHGVDLLAMLGSSKPDWGATVADLRALGINTAETREVYSHLVSARDVQGLARARHLRRRGVALLYIGDMSPPVGHDLPDVRWTQVEAAHPQASQEQQRLHEQAEALLLEHQWVSVPVLQKTLRVSRSKAESLCQRLTRMHHLSEWIHKSKGRGRGSKAYGFLSASPHDQQRSLLDLIDGVK